MGNIAPKKTLFDLVITCITHTAIVEITRRNAYDAAFKLNSIWPSKKEIAAARNLGIDEPMA